MSQTNMPPVSALRDVRKILANWLTDLEHGLSAREQETGKHYPETASISGNTVQGCLVDIVSHLFFSIVFADSEELPVKSLNCVWFLWFPVLSDTVLSDGCMCKVDLLLLVH